MIRSIFRSELIDRSHVDRSQSGEELIPSGSACGLQPYPEEWAYVVRGTSFLRYMVRKIVGTLLQVGRGKRTASDIPRLLEKRDRGCSGPTVPSEGLCLHSVEYPDPAASLTGKRFAR